MNDSERYEQMVADLVEAFGYEDCHECGQDIDRHTISPDMFGNPYAWCMGKESGNE